MNKNSTSYYYAIQKARKTEKMTAELVPSEETINNILRYASSHKTVKVSTNVFVKYSLN